VPDGRIKNEKKEEHKKSRKRVLLIHSSAHNIYFVFFRSDYELYLHNWENIIPNKIISEQSVFLTVVNETNSFF